MQIYLQFIFIYILYIVQLLFYLIYPNEFLFKKIVALFNAVPCISLIINLNLKKIQV